MLISQSLLASRDSEEDVDKLNFPGYIEPREKEEIAMTSNIHSARLLDRDSNKSNPFC